MVMHEGCNLYSIILIICNRTTHLNKNPKHYNIDKNIVPKKLFKNTLLLICQVNNNSEMLVDICFVYTDTSMALTTNFS